MVRAIQVAALAALLFCGVGSSATIVVTAQDTSKGENIWLLGDGAEIHGFAGNLDITLTVGTSNYYRTTYCVDLFTDIYLGQTYNTTVIQPLSVAGRHLDRASWLVQNYASGVASAAQGAGFQLALWDIIHDNGDGLTSGRVQEDLIAGHQTPTDVINWVTYYENLSVGMSDNNAFVYQNSNSNGQAQMLMGPKFNDGGPKPTPEPGTWGMMVGAGLLGVWRFRRRRVSG